MSEAEPDWIEYNDGRLAVRVPGDLRQHESILHFEGPESGPRTIILVNVNVLNHPQVIEARRSSIETCPIRDVQGGCEMRLLKRERPSWLENGLVLIVMNRSLATGARTYSLGALFERFGLTVDLEAVSGGELSDFERVIRKVIDSVRPARAGCGEY
jgi:hypothetical protein